MRRPLPVRGVLALPLIAALTLAPLRAHGTTYALTPADRAEITRVLRAFFEAARDGNGPAAAATLPTLEEFRALFPAGADPLIQRHQRAVERDVRELRQRFAGGTWVGLTAAFARAAHVELGPCARYAAPTGECTEGPVIEWRVGARTEHMRIDSLVRINGHWKIFDPRL